MSPNLKVLHTKPEIENHQPQTWRSSDDIWAMDKSRTTHRLITSFHECTLTYAPLPPQIT